MSCSDCRIYKKIANLYSLPDINAVKYEYEFNVHNLESKIGYEYWSVTPDNVGSWKKVKSPQWLQYAKVIRKLK